MREVDSGMMCTNEVKLKLECKRKFDEVWKLKKRLTHLEEETNLMKQEMLQERAERKTMLNEVYRQLKLVHFSLHSENQTFCKGEGLDGLCQVLYDDRNPSVFIRGGLGANSVADPRPAECIIPNVLCIEYDK